MAIAILIKNSARTGPADIQYRDMGDYLTREQKLDILAIEQSLEGTDWETITPNDHGDWINHRDERYDTFQPIGDKATKGKPTTSGVFENYSRGVATSRDAWCYNFSKQALESNMRRMIGNYNSAVDGGTEQLDRDPTKVSWNRALLTDLAKGKKHGFESPALIPSVYRPFTKQFAYFSREMNDMIYQLPRLFPTPNHPNLAIVMPQGGSAAAFSVLMHNMIPALTPNGGNQCFSLYAYEPVNLEAQGGLFDEIDSDVVEGYRRKDNVTDATLSSYRGFYEDPKIGKEDIFFYVYGLLHSPMYKEQYKADLAKMLPRIPKTKDFWGFSASGRKLADFHLNYEKVAPYPLEENITGTIGDEYAFYQVRKLSFGSRKDRTKIIYNSNITLAGIPDEVYEYQVNGKSALEWIIDRYQITTHKDSQITNDPNEYSKEIGNPRYILDLIKRIVTVSVETNKIVANLPVLEIAE